MGAAVPCSLGSWRMGVVHGNQSAPVTWCLSSQICFFIVKPPKWPELNRPEQCTADVYSPNPASISLNTEFELEALMLYNQDS